MYIAIICFLIFLIFIIHRDVEKAVARINKLKILLKNAQNKIEMLDQKLNELIPEIITDTYVKKDYDG